MLQPTRSEKRRSRPEAGGHQGGGWYHGAGVEQQKENRHQHSWQASPMGGSCDVKQNDSDNKKEMVNNMHDHLLVHHTQRKNRLQLLRDIL